MNVQNIFSHIPGDRHAAIMDCIDQLIEAIRASDTGGDVCAPSGACDSGADAKP